MVKEKIPSIPLQWFVHVWIVVFMAGGLLSACQSSGPSIAFERDIDTVTKTSIDPPFTVAATVNGGSNGSAPGTIVYHSSNPELAAVDAKTGTVTLNGVEGASGTVTITASAPASQDHNEMSTSYTLVVDSLACPSPTDNTFDPKHLASYELFEDFSNPLNIEPVNSTNSQNFSKHWMVRNETPGDIAVANGFVTIKSTANGGWHSSNLSTVDNFSRGLGDITVETDLTPSACSGDSVTMFYGPSGVGINDNIFLNFSDTRVRLGAVGGTVLSPNAVCVANHKFRLRLELPAGGGAEAYWYDISNGETAYPISPQLSLSRTQAATDNQLVSFSADKSFTPKATLDNVRITQTGIGQLPAHVLATPDNRKVLVQWDIGGGGNTVDVKPSQCKYWRTVGTVPRGGKGYTVTGLVNGQSYDFRVHTPGLVGASVTARATPNASVASRFANQILSTGQSLSVGLTANQILTSSQPYSNKMLNRINDAFLPLVEPLTSNISPVGMESMSSALYNSISAIVGSNSPYYQGIVSAHGVSGQDYSLIKKNGRGFSYSTGQVQMNAAMRLSVASGQPYRVLATTLVHGESDQGIGTTAAQYESDITQLQSDYESDAKNATGTTQTIPMFLNQRMGGCGAPMPPQTPIAQWSAGVHHPRKMHVVLPMYIFSYPDTCHLNSAGYRRMGEYFGKVMKSVMVDKLNWKPLQPKSIRIAGNIVTVRFHVPVAPLVFDTTLVGAKDHQGFEYKDDINSATITNVSLGNDGTSVLITLSKPPIGSNPRLRYAYTYATSDAVGKFANGAARGNLRDSDNTDALYCDTAAVAEFGPKSVGGCKLYNWGLTFDAAIPSNIWNMGDPITQPTALEAGVQIMSGEFLLSPNGQYQLILQGDGNLVLYRMADHAALWASNTNGKSAARFIFQGDGNAVIYDNQGTPIFATGTNGKGGVRLNVQDDGNLVMYSAQNQVTWSIR